MATLRTLCATPQLTVHSIACTARRSGRGVPRGGEATHVVFVHRGAFTTHVGARSYLADSCTALVTWEGSEYRISHPGDHGDDGTVVELAPALARELLATLAPHRDCELRLSPRLQLAYARFRTAAGDDTFDREHATLELLREVLGEPPLPGASLPQRALARGARELLHDAPDHAGSVSALAGQLGCSPFHLMHAFRAATGVTIRRYRMQLRVAAALHALAAGHPNLARLAAELGFASHAHLTSTIARLVGASPRELRAGLARGLLQA